MARQPFRPSRFATCVPHAVFAAFSEILEVSVSLGGARMQRSRSNRGVHAARGFAVTSNLTPECGRGRGTSSGRPQSRSLQHGAQAYRAADAVVQNRTEPGHLGVSQRVVRFDEHRQWTHQPDFDSHCGRERQEGL